jgi:hypothetical protein
VKRITKVDEQSGTTYEEDVDLGDVYDELESLGSSLRNTQRQLVAVLASINISGWAIVVLLLCHVVRHWHR